MTIREVIHELRFEYETDALVRAVLMHFSQSHGDANGNEALIALAKTQSQRNKELSTAYMDAVAEIVFGLRKP